MTALTPTQDAYYCARVKYSEPYHSAVEIQRLMLNDARNPLTEPKDRASLARSFAVLEDMKRKLRRIPPLKAVDVTKEKQPKSTGAPSFSEPASS